MPPNRIATSFAEAQEYGLPLSSTPLGKGGASIARGQACQTCRRRKLRCDGIRPLCTSCKKSAIAHGDNIDFLSCKYDEPETKKPRKRQTAGNSASTSASGGQAAADPAKVKELEAEIEAYTPLMAAELKAMMARAGLEPNARESPPIFTYAAGSSSTPPSGPASTSSRISAPTSTPWLPAGPGLADYSRTGPMNPSSTAVMPDHLGAKYPSEPVQLSPPSSGSSHGASPPSASPTHTSAPNSLFDLFYPGWPRDLPSPDLTSRLVEIYFTRPHAGQGMINASRFRSAMLLSPTSAGFPHSALIHAICAIAAMIISPDYFNSEEPYWQHSASSAGEYHFKAAKLDLERAISSGCKLFQIAQANVLLTYYAYNNAQFVALWILCGQATRMSTPLGLNHLRAASDADSLPKCIQGKGTMLSRTDDPVELVEQSFTFYGAVMADRFSAASTGWAVSLDDEDFSTPIPGLQGFPTSDVESSVLSPRNPSFFVAHPPHLVGPQQLYHKAIVLLGKIVQFSHRAPFTAKFTQSSLNDGSQDIRKTDAFKRLENTCLSFIGSIPREYQIARRSAMGIRADVLTEVNICLVHSIAHSAYILLHEPHVSSLNDDDEGMRKTLASANEILQAIFLTLNASTEISLYSPYINYCWAVAGRTFVRKIAMLQLACQPGARELRSNVETILAVLNAHRTPLGQATAAQLQAHLDDPYRALPYNLQQQARAQAGVPAPTALSLREMSGCPVMLDVAGTFTTEELPSSRFSDLPSVSPPAVAAAVGMTPPSLVALNSGRHANAVLQPLGELTGTIEETALLSSWSATGYSADTSPTEGIAFADIVQDSPIPMTGVIDEATTLPSPSSAGLSSDTSPSLYDFSSLSGSSLSSLAAPLGTSSATTTGSVPSNSVDLPFDASAMWNSNNGLDAIEALLKIQQAALG
ncbi:hypothetical protein JCM10908_005801 [Rhodotorula pacifica]|uniref:uncharacterized protein n=1 Tax=Rhodotorula pacifica TaxID=1495444 RepID=UPI00316B518F